jgi:WD40 repeat protein
MRIARLWRSLTGRGTTEEQPSAITELSRALAAGRPGGLQLFEKLTGNERLWWRCCLNAVQIQPSWLQYPDHDQALRLIRDTELVASAGAVLRAAEAVDLISQALATGTSVPAAQLSELTAHAIARWDDSLAEPMSGATGFTPKRAVASAVPGLRDQVEAVLASLENVGTDGGQTMAAICVLLLAADRPDMGRAVRVPVVFERPGEKQASSGVAGTLELREFPPGPSGLFPDPRGLRIRRADSAFDTGLRLAWQFAADAGRGGQCVLWRLSLDAGVPDYAIDGGSLGAAFAVALRELLRRPHGSGHGPLAALRAFFIGLRPKCAITGLLTERPPAAYEQSSARTAKGPWLDEVGGMDAKLEAARIKGFRLVAPAANRAAAHPRAAVPVDWAETIQQADRYARRIRPIRTAIASMALVLAALAVGLVATTAAAIGQRGAVISARDAAASNALVNQSEATGVSDPVIARLEAAAAWRLDPSSRAYYAMLSAAVLPWTAALSCGPDNQERSAVLSPDGTLLAAVTNDGIQLWNVATRTQVTTLPGGTVTVEGHTVPNSPGALTVAFSPNGAILAAGTTFGTQLWDVASRKQIGWLPASSGSTLSAVTALAFSPDGALLATGIETSIVSPDDEIQLWDVATRKPVTMFDAGTDTSVKAVAFSPDGRLLAVSTENPLILEEGKGAELWDVSNHKLITRFLDGTGNSLGVAFSPDGTMLAVAGTGGAFQLWDLAARTLITALSVSTSSPVDAVAFSPDGSLLAADTDDGTQLWDLATRTMIAALPASTGNSVNSVAFSPDGTLLAVGTGSGTWLASLAGRAASSSTAGLPSSIVSNAKDTMAFSPDGTLLAAGISGGTRLWDVATAKLVTTLPVSAHHSINAVAFSPDGALLAVGTSNGQSRGTVQLWDVAARKLVATLPATARDSVNAVAFSPDGTQLAITVGTEGTQLWNVATRQLVAMLPTGNDTIAPVAFSPDGTRLAFGDNESAQLWNIAARKLVATLPVGLSAIDSVSFSPDGTILFIGTSSGTELWDAGTVQQFASLSGYEAEVATLSHNGALLAVDSSGEPIRLLSIPYTWNTFSYLCRMAAEPFPPAEWSKYAPGVPYMKTCP